MLYIDILIFFCCENVVTFCPSVVYTVWLTALFFILRVTRQQQKKTLTMEQSQQ